MSDETIVFLCILGAVVFFLIVRAIVVSVADNKTRSYEAQCRQTIKEHDQEAAKQYAEKEKALRKEYDKKIASLSADAKLLELNTRLSEVRETEKHLRRMEEELNDREEYLDCERNKVHEKEKDLKRRFSQFEDYAIKELKSVLRSSTIPTDEAKPYFDSFFTDRGIKSLSEHMTFSDISCSVTGESGIVYHTTLHSCTCPDNSIRKIVCKHMIALSIKTFTLPLKDFKKSQDEFIENYTQETIRLRDEVKSFEEKLSELSLLIEEEQKKYQFYLSEKETITKLKNDAMQSFSVSFPWLSEAFADLGEQIDGERLSSVSSHAVKSADIIKEMRAEKRALRTKVSYYENILKTYENLFPWLEDFSEVHLDDAMAYVNELSDDSYYERTMLKWLSPEEYASLTTASRNQLALDRYMSRKKTDWEAGIEYERYVGYLYESSGYTVKYVGALDGLQDMGRDLIAEKDGTVYVIQCKRWAKEKQIHEKHIFQIFGTTYALSVKNPGKKYVPVFYTTASLSPVALQCASGLDVEVHENAPLEKYPLIKCNIGKDENGKPTKIYHLPFDQQYDTVQISFDKGETYEISVTKAEMNGFRHAYRHKA